MAEKEITHELVREHKVLAKEDGEKIFAQFRVSRLQIPKIRVKDAGLAGKAKAGQVISVERPDGSLYYRLVVE